MGFNFEIWLAASVLLCGLGSGLRFKQVSVGAQRIVFSLGFSVSVGAFIGHFFLLPDSIIAALLGAFLVFFVGVGTPVFISHYLSMLVVFSGFMILNFFVLNPLFYIFPMSLKWLYVLLGAGVVFLEFWLFSGLSKWVLKKLDTGT